MQDLKNSKNSLPKRLYPLFWEYDPATIDIHEHSDLIIERVIQRGSWTDTLWLIHTYTRARLSSFLENKGICKLAPRELNYWALICGIPPEKRRNWLREREEKFDAWNHRHSHRSPQQRPK